MKVGELEEVEEEVVMVVTWGVTSETDSRLESVKYGESAQGR